MMQFISTAQMYSPYNSLMSPATSHEDGKKHARSKPPNYLPLNRTAGQPTTSRKPFTFLDTIIFHILTLTTKLFSVSSLFKKPKRKKNQFR